RSYKLDGVYQKNLTDPARVNYGEFWVRRGETFSVETVLSDDAGLDNFKVFRLDRTGARVEQLFSSSYLRQCPEQPLLHITQAIEIQFDQAEPVEYQLVLTDTFGQQVTRNFLVHPLSNVVPEVRITGPADQQEIVAGTFRVKVGIVATDDRWLTKSAG